MSDEEPDDVEKGWAEHDRQEQKRRLEGIRADKENRLKALGLRPAPSASACIHCGRPIGGDSSGAEYGICQDCID